LPVLFSVAIFPHMHRAL